MTDRKRAILRRVSFVNSGLRGVELWSDREVLNAWRLGRTLVRALAALQGIRLDSSPPRVKMGKTRK